MNECVSIVIHYEWDISDAFVICGSFRLNCLQATYQINKTDLLCMKKVTFKVLIDCLNHIPQNILKLN